VSLLGGIDAVVFDVDVRRSTVRSTRPISRSAQGAGLPSRAFAPSSWGMPAATAELAMAREPAYRPTEEVRRV